MMRINPYPNVTLDDFDLGDLLEKGYYLSGLRPVPRNRKPALCPHCRQPIQTYSQDERLGLLCYGCRAVWLTPLRDNVVASHEVLIKAILIPGRAREAA
jgi:hypothetical protein